MDGARPDPRRWIVRLAGMLAGGALVVAFPEPALWWWAYVGLVPVVLIVVASGDRREAMWRSWFAAAGFLAALHYWLVPHLSVFAVAVVGVVAVVWIPWGLAAWRLLRPPVTLPRLAAVLVLLPAAWLVIEYARSWDRFGGSWGLLGLTQWNVRPVLAVTALGGVWALSLLLVLTNVAVAGALARGVPNSGRALCVAVVAVVLAGALAYGAARGEPAVEGVLRVGGVQPGLIHDPADRLDANVRITRDLMRRDPSIDVVVWGQSSVGYDLELADDVRERLLRLAAEVDRQIVVNVDARRPDGRIAKTSVVVEPDGVGAVYRKQRLVPFGEYIPLRSVFGWVERFTDAANEDRVPGASLTTFELAGVRVGPLISYESTFPDMRRSLAQRGVSMTLVQAAATTFQGTWALPQQASFEAVRAVASGRPAVLVSVSGTSAAFDARGRRLAWVPQTSTGAWAVDVPLSQERTLFVRWGPWVPLSAVALAAVAALTATGRWLAGRRRAQRTA